MQKMAADFPTMWAENRGFLAYPIRTRNCIFTQLHCRRRHKKPKNERLKRFVALAVRRAIANLKERHKNPCIVADRTIEAIRCEGAARYIKRAKTTYRANILYR